MATVIDPQIRCAILVIITLCFTGASARAKYSGGTGEPNDPYQIATAADLIALGETPEDYDKHFILCADIDLDPNLPGRKVFDRSVIAPAFRTEAYPYMQGSPFTGVFDGNNHKISHLTILGTHFLGMFGQLESGAEVKDLCVVDVNITGSGDCVGGLIGRNGDWEINSDGSVIHCSSTGVVGGISHVGGLVGWNSSGSIVASYSSASVSGTNYVGGLVGNSGDITTSYSTGSVTGTSYVGGLVGSNGGTQTQCYSTAAVSGTSNVGGLVGYNAGYINVSYSTGLVGGEYDTGGLVGSNGGTLTQCYSTAAVSGTSSVGGLVGYNGSYGSSSVTQCYSSGTVSGKRSVGGLVGQNGLGGMGHYFPGYVTQCYSTAAVSGESSVGGLVGANSYVVNDCYSTGSVNGSYDVGGFVGYNIGGITTSYSTGSVSGTSDVGGLVGSNTYYFGGEGIASYSFWDVQTSEQATSAGGEGKTTVEMQTAKTFLDVGWDFVGETANGTEDVWKIIEGITYPLLSWQKYSGGTGEPNDPYQIATAADLIALGETPEDYDKHFLLTADIDLDPNLPGGRVFDKAVIAPDANDAEDGFQGTSFTGVFDGNGHKISHVTIQGQDCLGLFGQSWGWWCEVRNLGVVDVNMTGIGHVVGGVVGYNGGAIERCYSTGLVKGNDVAGGLVGLNYSGGGGSVTQCYSTCTISGKEYIGGLVGNNTGWVAQCCSIGTVTGERHIGGLVGLNNSRGGRIISSYSTSAVSGRDYVGGLVGLNSPNLSEPGAVNQCYSTGATRGTGEYVGGLVGYNGSMMEGTGIVTASFWDTETSGQLGGCTTAEMQAASTFLDAGWDFVGEMANGTEDIWWILEGQDYPRLWWELITEN